MTTINVIPNKLIKIQNTMLLHSGKPSFCSFLTDLWNACWSTSEDIRLTSDVKIEISPLLTPETQQSNKH